MDMISARGLARVAPGQATHPAPTQHLSGNPPRTGPFRRRLPGPRPAVSRPGQRTIRPQPLLWLVADGTTSCGKSLTCAERPRRLTSGDAAGARPRLPLCTHFARGRDGCYRAAAARGASRSEGPRAKVGGQTTAQEQNGRWLFIPRRPQEQQRTTHGPIALCPDAVTIAGCSPSGPTS